MPGPNAAASMPSGTGSGQFGPNTSESMPGGNQMPTKGGKSNLNAAFGTNESGPSSNQPNKKGPAGDPNVGGALP